MSLCSPFRSEPTLSIVVIAECNNCGKKKKLKINIIQKIDQLNKTQENSITIKTLSVPPSVVATTLCSRPHAIDKTFLEKEATSENEFLSKTLLGAPKNKYKYNLRK